MLHLCTKTGNISSLPLKTLRLETKLPSTIAIRHGLSENRIHSGDAFVQHPRFGSNLTPTYAVVLVRLCWCGCAGAGNEGLEPCSVESKYLQLSGCVRI